MAKTDFKSVGHYIAARPEAIQGVLELVRSTIRKALPGAEEVISYQIPAYKLRGETVIYFAGWKQHYSLYPVTAHLVEAFKDDIAPYELNDRGTLRFPLAQPVPMNLIARIAKLRAKQVAHRRKWPRQRNTRHGSETKVDQTDICRPHCEPASPECSCCPAESTSCSCIPRGNDRWIRQVGGIGIRTGQRKRKILSKTSRSVGCTHRSSPSEPRP